ncbi:juvenile hormone epoxide hydrolase 2-like [Xylocopa sonorina]|uniref:juvenile hormone epoxide hydrolase 2-like n=1 Tax=Xylocopa sonorina TaxID=1818115 RepID=UPI00403A7D48
MWITTAILALCATGIALFLSSTSKLEVPTLPETNWGSNKNEKASTEIRPFKINVSPTVLDDLKYRLAHRRSYTEPLENAAWTYGISSKFLNTILDYWKDKYNWSERQALLNKYPQYITNIQGLDIHFYHIKPTNLPKDKNLKVLPLLLLHGWPGSIVEFQKIIPMLTTPRPNQSFVFEVIAPSLPGYGFSEGAVRPGMASAQISVILKNLMQRVGFKRFYVQGGDWGSVVAANMAALFPEKVRGLHLNMCNSMTLSNFIWLGIGTYFPSLIGVHENYSLFLPISKHISLLLNEFGYFHIQATKPDTLGVALTASPDGLAAYILEKFVASTYSTFKESNNDNMVGKFTFNELLDNLMIYWITNSSTTSIRLYAENLSSTYRALKIEQLPVEVPTGCAIFPKEIFSQPQSLLRNRYPNIIHYNIMPRGGHFAAFEEPTLLADDIFSFIKKIQEL